MALSETTFDPSAADLINLRKILEACIHVPDIHDVSAQSCLSREQRFCMALDRFESTTKVFDVGTYEAEVLHVGTTEEELDDRLRREARDVGVVDAHFPTVKRRKIHHRTSKHVSNLQRHSAATTDSNERKSSVAFTDSLRASSTFNGPAWTPPSVRASVSSRPSLSAPASDRAIARHSVVSANTTHEPTPAQSVVSFKSTSSQSSSLSKFFGKRRDSRHSLGRFFRRESSSRTSSVSVDTYPMSPAEPASHVNHNRQHIIEEEPDLASPHSHESQDLSSIQSLSISSRTSVSSFGDHQPDHELSGLDRQRIERFVTSFAFVKLQAACEEEIQRFNRFAMDQHIALPLILGRNHLYNQDRMKVRLAELQKEHDHDIEKMDDRFADKELQLREIQRVAMEEHATRNATALKHVASRIALLGDEATPEHHQRLEEEQSALKRLANKHDNELRKLVRYQESKKLELQRKQAKDMEEMTRSLETGLVSQRKEKTAKLQHNISRLDELVEERRARLVARFFLRLQVLKCMSNDTVAIDLALPLSLLGLPTTFTASLGYS